MGTNRLGLKRKLAIDELSEVVFKRFEHNPEGAVDYVTGTIDRQIAKASSLLTYNSILFAGLSSGGSLDQTARVASYIALASCAVLLVLLSVKWREQNSYADPRTDFHALVALAARRSKVLSLSIVLSVIGTGAACVVLWKR